MSKKKNKEEKELEKELSEKPKVKRKRRKKKKKGFTLIELLAVIVILGLLMAIAIPSVTKYITESRKKTVTTTVSNYIGALVNEVNDLEYTFTGQNIIYAIPIECISLERGGTSPFGEWYQANDNYWAYVLIQYDDQNSKYVYGFTFKDSAGYGLYPLTESNIKENGSQIKTGLDLTKPESGSITGVTSMQVWNISGFSVDDDTQLKVLEAESEGIKGNGETTCTLCQAGKNYAQVEEVKLEKKSLYAAVKKVGELYTGEGSSSYKKEVYFHQDSLSNNVLFANYCWKIVRTTDTGGVKIIYNGEPVNGVCDNSGVDTRITTTSFNDFSEDLSAVSYMGNAYYEQIKDNFEYSARFVSSVYLGSSSYYYADSIKYENGTYYLYNSNGSSLSSTSWSSNSSTLIGKFVCSNRGSSCSDAYYVDSKNNTSYAYVLSLTNGNIFTKLNISKTISKDESGNYILNSPTALSAGDFLKKPSLYNDYYVCSDMDETTCSTIYNLHFNTTYKNLYYSSDDTYVFGNSFEYKNGEYILKNTISEFNLIEEKLGNAHYTCFNSSGVCEEVAYIYSINEDPDFHGRRGHAFIVLSNGENVNDAVTAMLHANDVNEYNSNIKNVVEDWYEDTMTDYTDYLEDTVFCNDRRISTLGGWNPNSSDFSTHLKFYSFDYADLTCGNKTDKFTVSSSIGNGKLKYPVGLITAGEANLWGARASDVRYWTMSPFGFSDYSAYGFQVFEDGFVNFDWIDSDELSVRPVVSLKPGTAITSGNGTAESPYIIG